MSPTTPTFQDIQRVTHAVVRQFRPQRVIMFGSRVYGTPTPASDVDLLVILPFDGSPYQMNARLLAAIESTWAGSQHAGFDIKARRPEDIAWRYNEGDPMIRDAIDRGIVLFEAAA